MTEIKHSIDGDTGSFDYIFEGEKLAEIIYTKISDSQMTIDHTEVHESLKGLGIGKKLLETIVEYARTKNLKIIPMCSFAKVTFDRVEEWRDVLLVP